MKPHFSESVLKKMSEKHGISVGDVIECFANRCGPSLMDTREEHKTDPPTRWFVAETNRGVKIKVVYIPIDGRFEIKTAYPANTTEINIYRRAAGASI